MANLRRSGDPLREHSMPPWTPHLPLPPACSEADWNQCSGPKFSDTYDLEANLRSLHATSLKSIPMALYPHTSVARPLQKDSASIGRRGFRGSRAAYCDTACHKGVAHHWHPGISGGGVNAWVQPSVMRSARTGLKEGVLRERLRLWLRADGGQPPASSFPEPGCRRWPAPCSLGVHLSLGSGATLEAGSKGPKSMP